MSAGFQPSPQLRASLQELLEAMAAAGVPDPGVGYGGSDQLTPTQRRLLLLLAASEAVAPPEAPTVAPATAEEDSPPAEAGELPATAPEGEPPVPEGAPEPPPQRLDAPQPGGIPPLPPGEEAAQMLEPLRKSLFLKNAKAGEPYQASLAIEGIDQLQLLAGEIPGLTLDLADATLHGIPTSSGDFRLRLLGQRHGQGVEITANLAVIPDPYSLWANKPSNPEVPFWKPDSATLRLDTELLCVGASQRGRSHAHEGSCRDDDLGLLRTADGWYIAAVADGAGSARLSRRGSQLAVATVLHELPPLLEQQLAPQLERLLAAHQQGNGDATRQLQSQIYQSLVTAAFAAAKAIEAEAEAYATSAAAFFTTLVLCVARPLATGWFCAGFSVGDGGAALFDLETMTLTPLSAADSGEYAGQTRFLQRSEFAGGFEEVARRIFFCHQERFTFLALMTDGISDAKLPTAAAFADPEQWRQLWCDDLNTAVAFDRANPALEQQLLDWLGFRSPGNHDDRTIALLLP